MNAVAKLVVCLLLIAGGGAIGHRQMVPARHSGPSSAEVEGLAAADSPLASLAARSGWRVAGAVRGRLNGRRVVMVTGEAADSMQTVARRLRAHIRTLSLEPHELDLGFVYVAWAEGAHRCAYTLAAPQGRQGGTVVFGIGSDGPLRISSLDSSPSSPGADLAGLPAYPGQKRALVFESDDRRLGVAVYRVASPRARVKGFFDDQFRAQGWRDLLETRQPKWSLREEPLVFQGPNGDVCLMTFAPITGTRETGYLIYRWQTLESKP